MLRGRRLEICRDIWHAPDTSALDRGRTAARSSAYGSSTATAMPHLDTASITMATRRPLTFRARADNLPVTLILVARAHHQHYTV